MGYSGVEWREFIELLRLLFAVRIGVEVYPGGWIAIYADGVRFSLQGSFA